MALPISAYIKILPALHCGGSTNDTTLNVFRDHTKANAMNHVVVKLWERKKALSLKTDLRDAPVTAILDVPQIFRRLGARLCNPGSDLARQSCFFPSLSLFSSVDCDTLWRKSVERMFSLSLYVRTVGRFEVHFAGGQRLGGGGGGAGEACVRLAACDMQGCF